MLKITFDLSELPTLEDLKAAIALGVVLSGLVVLLALF